MKIVRSSILLVAVITLSFVSVSAQARSVKSLEKALSTGSRPEADMARDAGRRPAEVVSFLGIEKGMTVIDLIAAGGYYSEVLSIAVGRKGKVYAHNTDYVLKFRDGANEAAISERLEGGRLPNVERINAEVTEMNLAPNSIDAALTALNFHDIVNGRGAAATFEFLAAVKKVLKPGGIFGVIDHDGDPGNDNRSLHRMPKADAIALLKAAGFEFVGEGEMLRNPADDHTRNVFAEGLRGNTDRFVLRFRKP